MIKFSATNELLEVAQRTVWFKPPSDAIQNTLHFIAHVLTYGTHSDVMIVRKYLSDQDLREAIEQAPPGIFDPRSWAYWNIMMGRYPTPPLPKRVL